MKQIPSPCLDCTSRHIGCHSDCEKYLLFRSNRDEILDTIRKNKSEYCKINDYQIAATIKRSSNKKRKQI